MKKSRLRAKKSKKSKRKESIAEAVAVCQFWQPYLVEFAKEGRSGVYEHPWVPVCIMEKLLAILNDESGYRSY